MNALDYGRDNRLRLWFIDPDYSDSSSIDSGNCMKSFKKYITALAKIVETSLKRKGHCVIVVGEQTRRSNGAHPAREVSRIMAEKAPSLHLIKVMVDSIPDVRRSRRNCAGTKREHFLVFQRR